MRKTKKVDPQACSAWGSTLVAFFMPCDSGSIVPALETFLENVQFYPAILGPTLIRVIGSYRFSFSITH
jgi:hypothetical protein